MNYEDLWKYLTGLTSDELRLLAKDKLATQRIRDGAQTLLDARTAPPDEESSIPDIPTPRSWARKAELVAKKG